MTPDPLHQKLVAYVQREANAGYAASAHALLAVLAEHAPGETPGTALNSTKCPDHNPKDHPDLFAASVDYQQFKDCPTCEWGEYETCSSWDCSSCDYPCTTIDAIAGALADRGVTLR